MTNDERRMTGSEFGDGRSEAGDGRSEMGDRSPGFGDQGARGEMVEYAGCDPVAAVCDRRSWAGRGDVDIC